MLVDQNTYNSPAGKIDLTSWGTIAYTDAGVTRNGSINNGTGATYDHGTAIAGQYFGNLDTWAKLLVQNNNPVYIKYTPSGTLPAGVMVAVKAQFEGATAGVYDGKGEAAVYGRFSTDESDIRLLMYMGVQESTGIVYHSGGWLTPGDEGDEPSLAFIVHYRNIFTEISGLLGKTWPDVKDIRLVFRNQTDAKKVKIQDFRIYESVSDGPTGSVVSYDSTSSTMTIVPSAQGAASTVGAGNAGISNWSLVFDSPTATDTRTGTLSPPADLDDPIELTDLPPIARTTYMALYDTYGNVGYLEDSYGLTTKANGTFTVTPTGDWTTTELIAQFTDPGLSLMNYCFYQELKDPDTGVVSMVPLDSAEYDPEPQADSTPITYTVELDPTGGAKFQVNAYARAVVTGTSYFFELDDTIDIEDTRGASVIVDAYSAQNRGFVSVRAEDASGIKEIEYILRRSGQPDLPYDTTSPSAPYMITIDDSVDFAGDTGELVTVIINVTDGADNVQTVQVDVVIAEGGDVMTSGFQITPDIKATISADAHVLLEWTSWAGVMPPVSGVRYPPARFEIYRKKGVAGTYSLLSDDVPGASHSYIDDTLAEPAVYYYCVVAVDKFEQRKSVEIAADVAAATIQTKYSFVEPYLSMLPKWTAAIPKRDTFK